MKIISIIITEWKFIISSLISIGGFIITICHFNKQIKAVKDEKVTDLQREVYLEVYEHIDKIINDNSLFFDKDYIAKLLYYKGKMKLVASKNTLSKYKSIFEELTKLYSDYMVFYDNNDPEKRVEEVVDNETGESYEIAHYTEDDMHYFNNMLEEYKQNILSINSVNNLLNDLVNSMRRDLNID